MIHRDLKPGNILLQHNTEGEIAYRISDFGIGDLTVNNELRTAEQMKLPTLMVSGLSTRLRTAHTTLYASPQQRSGQPSHPTDDVYSLGVLWFQLLVGDLTRPLDHEWRDDLQMQGISQAAIQLIAECTRKNAENRPQDGLQLAKKMKIAEASDKSSLQSKIHADYADYSNIATCMATRNDG
ncbi:MAG: hypothetical protein R3B84_17145 [Zavarzinella sp.]